MKRFVSLLVLAILAVGCSGFDKSLAPKPIFDETSKSLKPSPGAPAVSFEAYYTNIGVMESDYEAQTKNLGLDQKTEVRDQYLNNVMIVEERLYQDYRNHLRSNTALRQSVTGFISIALSSAATLYTGPAAQALSATDTAIKAANGVIDKDFLADQTIDALLNSMDSRRAIKKAAIVKNMLDEADRYTLAEGLKDIAALQGPAALVNAIESLNAEAGMNKVNADRLFDNVQQPESKAQLKSKLVAERLKQAQKEKATNELLLSGAQLQQQTQSLRQQIGRPQPKPPATTQPGE